MVGLCPRDLPVVEIQPVMHGRRHVGGVERPLETVAQDRLGAVVIGNDDKAAARAVEQMEMRVGHLVGHLHELRRGTDLLVPEVLRRSTGLAAIHGHGHGQ